MWVVPLMLRSSVSIIIRRALITTGAMSPRPSPNSVRRDSYSSTTAKKSSIISLLRCMILSSRNMIFRRYMRDSIRISLWKLMLLIMESQLLRISSIGSTPASVLESVGTTNLGVLPKKLPNQTNSKRLCVSQKKNSCGSSMA